MLSLWLAGGGGKTPPFWAKFEVSFSKYWPRDVYFPMRLCYSPRTTIPSIPGSYLVGSWVGGTYRLILDIKNIDLKLLLIILNTSPSNLYSTSPLDRRKKFMLLTQNHLFGSSSFCYAQGLILLQLFAGIAFATMRTSGQIKDRPHANVTKAFNSFLQTF